MLSIVVPVFNEEKNLEHLYERLVNSSAEWNEKYEVIFVDDGSTDDTISILLSLSEKDARIKIIKFSRNFGHQAAISAGIEKAIGEAVIVMDGDLQDPPEEIIKLIEKWREGYQVVYAIRKKRKESFVKRLSYSIFYRLLAFVSEIDIPLDSGDFCLMDRLVVNVLNDELVEKIRFVRGLRAFAGFKQIGIEYERAERAAGEVKYTFRKLVRLALDGLMDFSIIPLRISSYLGFFIAFLSFLIGIFFVIHRIFGFKVLGYSPQDVPGLASLAIGIFFLGGITLMVLGIIGNYLARIYFEVKRRPTYIIEKFYKSEVK
jgi:dolichol-phosphate mannosyltransferase